MDSLVSGVGSVAKHGESLGKVTKAAAPLASEVWKVADKDSHDKFGGIANAGMTGLGDASKVAGGF